MRLLSRLAEAALVVRNVPRSTPGVPMGKLDQASWNLGRKVGRTLWGPLSLLKAEPEGGWGDKGRERKLMKT